MKDNNGTITLPKYEQHTPDTLPGVTVPEHPEVVCFGDYLQSIQNEPDPVPILGQWIYAGEVTLLAGSTNTGKSTLAMQIAMAISKGECCLTLENKHPPSKVIVYDFESKPHQLRKRYGMLNLTDNQNFYFCNDVELLDDSTKLFAKIETHLESLNPKIVIIDNIGYLTDRATVDQQAALQLMKGLSKLCKKYRVAILVIVHTPKRPADRPLTKYDLEGSAKIINYADSSFFIAESKDPEQRYLKQVKCRNEPVFNEVLLIEWDSDPYLHFEFVGPADESEVLPGKATAGNSNNDALVKTCQKIFGISGKRYTDLYLALMDELSISDRTAKRKIAQMENRNIIVRNPDGLLILNNETLSKLGDEDPF